MPKNAAPLVELPDEDVQLSQKQDRFFELIAQGQSVFITGAAGTGRIWVLVIMSRSVAYGVLILLRKVTCVESIARCVLSIVYVTLCGH